MSFPVVSASTFASRVLGMVRDIACAALLGAGAAWDAFVVAWRIPNLFRKLLGEGALSSAFIPVFSGERESGGRQAAFRFFSTVLTLLTLVLAGVTLSGIAVAWLMPGSWFGAGAGKADLTLSLLRILFPYVLFVNVMALFMAILNSLDHFFAPAIAPAVLNVFWIAGALLSPRLAGTPAGQVRIVAVAILLGGAAQLAIQIPFLRARGVPLRPRLELGNPAVRRMLLLMVPMVIGLAPVQVNLLLDALIAEAFVPGDGANSYLFYGNRLMQFPLAIIGIAMAVVVFPVFARQAKAGRQKELGGTLTTALTNTFFLSLPAAAGLLALAAPLIALIYEWGAFGRGDTNRTAMVLTMYSVGIPAYCGLQVLTRLFYSLEEVKTPVTVGALMVLVNLALNLALVFPMGESGLALATALSAMLNLGVLAVIARRRLKIRGLRGVAGSSARSLAMAAAMGAAVYGASHLLSQAMPDRTLVARLLRVLPPTILGLLLYLGGAFLLRVPEIRALLRRRGARE